MGVELELFTLQDKYMLMFLAILIFIFSVGLFVWLESLNETKKIQIKSKKVIRAYKSIFSILLILSFVFVAIPLVENKTINVEKRLVEALIDNENELIMFKAVENAYYPAVNVTFHEKVISWYTVDFKDQRYLHSEEILDTAVRSDGLLLYEVNNSRILAINETEKPVEYRGTDVQSFWYSLVFVIYNILIAIIVYPLFSVYKAYIKLLWKSQNIISILLLSIMISNSFVF